MSRVLIVVAVGLLGMAGTAEGQAADGLPGTFDPGPAAMEIGVDTAPVVVVEFFDYRCEYCAAQAREVFGQIRSRFVESGQVRYVLAEALRAGDVEAERAASAARCAGESGRYLEARRYLFAEAVFAREGPLDLAAFADAVGTDPGQLVFCVETGRHTGDIRNVVARATTHRVTATPTFFFGYPVDSGAGLTVERHVVGEIGAEQFGQIVAQLIQSRRQAEARRRVDR